MKKNILSLSILLFVFYAKAQEINNTFKPKSPVVFAAELGSNVGAHFGLTLEFENPLFKSLRDPNVVRKKQHSVFKLAYKEALLDNNLFLDIEGDGFSIQYGSKSYFNKHEYKGFYFADYIMYGSIKFDDTYYLPLFGSLKFNGTYSYFSFFSPEIGYKFFLLDDKFTFDLHLGVSWMIEIKGKGDVDNKHFDNWVPKFGFALGYRL